MIAALRRLPLHWQILGAMALAVAVGLAISAEGQLAGVEVLPALDTLGKLFMNALKLLVVPLVMSSVISGVASLGTQQGLGRIGGRTLTFYVVTTLLAVLVALAISNLIKPGEVDGVPAADRLALTSNSTEVADKVAARSAVGLGATLLSAVPANIIEAAASTKLIGVVVFSLLFGYFLARVPAERGGTVVLEFWRGVFEVMIRITEFIMKLAPIGVFALVAATVARTGFDAARPLVIFSGSVLLGLLVFATLVLPLLVWLIGRVSPWRIFPAMAPALLTAFSTASSSAALATAMDCVEKRAGVSNRVAGFVMPLGASINHAGSALYECAAAMFIAQAYGLHLSIGVQFTIVVLALVTSMGIAGIPAASLVAITLILTAIGLPAEAIGVLFVFDRVLDMARTTVNILADSVCAVIIARLEGETGVLAKS